MRTILELINWGRKLWDLYANKTDESRTIYESVVRIELTGSKWMMSHHFCLRSCSTHMSYRHPGRTSARDLDYCFRQVQMEWKGGDKFASLQAPKIKKRTSTTYREIVGKSLRVNRVHSYWSADFQRCEYTGDQFSIIYAHKEIMQESSTICALLVQRGQAFRVI